MPQATTQPKPSTQATKPEGQSCSTDSMKKGAGSCSTEGKKGSCG